MNEHIIEVEMLLAKLRCEERFEQTGNFCSLLNIPTTFGAPGAIGWMEAAAQIGRNELAKQVTA